LAAPSLENQSLGPQPSKKPLIMPL